MPHIPTPHYSFNIDGVEFGIYYYTKRSEQGALLSSGFTICPAQEMKAGKYGYNDPELNTRIDFSADRGVAVAIAGGTDPTGGLDEKSRRTAIAVMDKLQDYLNQPHHVGAGLKMRRTLSDEVDQTPFDEENSTAIYVRSNSITSGRLLIVLRNAAEEIAHNWKHHLPSQPSDIIEKIEMQPKTHVERAKPLSQESQMLERIGSILMNHFPNDEHDKNRAAATAELMKLISKSAERTA